MATVSRYSHLGRIYIPGFLNVIAKPAHHERVEPPPRSNKSNIQTVGDSSSGHVCHSSQLASSSVYVSRSRAMSTGDRCSVTRLAEAVDVHVAAVKVIQKLKTTQKDELILIAPWCPSQPWFPHLLRLCVNHPRFFQFR